MNKKIFALLPALGLAATALAEDANGSAIVENVDMSSYITSMGSSLGVAIASVVGIGLGFLLVRKVIKWIRGQIA